MITDSFDDRSKAIIEPFVNKNAPEVEACIVTFSDKIEQHFDIALGLAEFISGLAADKVLTINDWWDGPLLGLCTFGGKYCVFERVFSDEKDDYTGKYWLTLVDETAAREIISDYRRWCEFMKNGGNADEWKSAVDIVNIVKNSPNYRKFTRYAIFKGIFPGCCEEIKDYFVQWC